MGRFDDLLTPRSKKLKHNASFLRRTGAFLIDILLIDLILTIPFQPLFSRLLTESWPYALTQQELAAAFVLFLLTYTYFVLFEFNLQQTPGMMLLSIRVKDAPKVWQALVRNSFLIPIFPLIILWITEPLSLLLTGQSFLERITKTRTLHERTMVF